MKYVIEKKTIKAGLFADAQDKIAKEIQPMLDEGSSKGWKLHTMFDTDSAKGINITMVWEIG